MSLLPDTASFAERVQDCFAAYRGKGVALSAVDVELVEAWGETGVPAEVVARGIRAAAEAALWDAVPGETGLRSLTACRRAVEAEIKKWLKLAAGKTAEAEPDDAGGAGAEAFHLARHKKLLAALKRLKKERPDLAEAISRLLPRLAAPADFAASEREEDLALAVLLRALPCTKRLELLREARTLVQNAHATSARARRESFRFHRAALVRRELELKAFW